MATEAGIPVVLTTRDQAVPRWPASALAPGSMPPARRRPTRLLWLEHASDTQGALHIDAGAVRALAERNASLLPAGITSVTGRSWPVTRSMSSTPMASSSLAAW